MASNPSFELETWVRDQYRQRCCDKDGRQIRSSDNLAKEVSELRPNDKSTIKVIMKKINQERYEMPAKDFGQLIKQIRDERRRFPSNERGHLQDKAAFVAELLRMRPDCHPARIKQAVTIVEKKSIKPPNGSQATQPEALLPIQTRTASSTGGGISPRANPELETWVYDRLLEVGFSSKEYIIQAGTQACSKSDTGNSSKCSRTSRETKSAHRLHDSMNLLLAKSCSFDSGYNEHGRLSHDIWNAVLVSADIVQEAGEELLPQYGLLGTFSYESTGSSKGQADDRFLLNTNIPFSAFICGVQGSGKSHTTSCLLENCLIRSEMLGNLESPLSALVFHFSEFSSRTSYNPSEAAYLAMAHCEFPNHPTAAYVTVLVSPSNYYNLCQLYAQFPKAEVRPFKLKPQMLDVGTMLMLMAVDQSKDRPLYMAQVTKVLRDMATEMNGDFDYRDFQRRLRNQKFDSKQMDFLNQRLGLLESFLDLDGLCTEPIFRPGEITIMDMSCPFVDSNTACVLFKIALRKYLESSAPGKVIVLDEAHKYMIETPGAKDLNEFLLTVIRQQRHFGARVIISTQEPTITPQLIDLCAITIIHRFSSPEWFRTLKKHISVSSDSSDGDPETKNLFRKILNLRTGEAFVFAPTAVVGKDLNGELLKATEMLLKVCVRKRVTQDGGQSVVCV